MNKSRKSLVSFFSKNVPELEVTEEFLFGTFSGTRLTYQGNQLLNNYFNNYVFPITEIIPLYKKTLLNEQLYTPYYLSEKVLVLYDEQDAQSLTLIGDMSLWIESLIAS
jgi:hypothetical protein